jgi:hypothetical protein
MTQNIKTIALAALLACGLPAVAAPIQLKFEGLSVTTETEGVKSTPDVLVDNFYGGGSSKSLETGNPVVTPADQDFGTVFDGPAVATASSDTGGDGLFTTIRTLIIGGDLSASDALGTGAVYAGGLPSTSVSFSILTSAVFDTALSFFYSGTASFTVAISGASGTLETWTSSAITPPTGASCGAIPSDISCFWAAVSIPFSGDANRVVVSGIANSFLLDNITLGSGDPLTPIDPGVPAIPEPSTYVLMALGLAAVGYTARRRKQRG